MSQENSPVVSAIVPARNEEACLGSCLESLVRQGIDFEIIVVDDGSTDRTQEIAKSFSEPRTPNHFRARNEAGRLRGQLGAGAVHKEDLRPYAPVTVISAPPLPDRWTGKNNAMSGGAKIARGKWLLFTDADTVHKPGSLARAVAEAEEHGAALLSYSPEQEVRTFWERAVMPVIFAELAATYPPEKVNDRASPIAAANGQYLLISREVYDAVGGHTKISSDLLEDVAMARLVKSSGRRIFFRYGGDIVRTRMYRSWAQMKEGWTKNLALLFKHPARRALMLLGFWVLAWIAFALGLAAIVSGYWRMAYYVLPWFLLYGRIRSARFRASANLVAIAFGIPLVAYLFAGSIIERRNGAVIWKGRYYQPDKA
jgi:glycosyltransferase involved in cell wall biosynthesis